LNGNSITVNPAGSATVDGSKVTISSAATYRISGSLTNGQVIVNVTGAGTVRLILNGVDIRCSTSSPIYVIDAKKTVIVLQASTANYITDGASYILEAGTDEPNAAVFSKKDLTIFGDGSLNVDANYNDAIASKDGLIIKSGTITVSSVDDGIRGKDYLVVKGGTITLNTGGDGLKSDDDSDVARGYVSVEAGVINVVSGADAVEAETDVTVTGGTITLTSGGGSNNVASASAKGIQANVSIIIDGGTFTVDSADDAFNSNYELTINGGSFVISTGDDAFHADSSLTINGGDIDITKSYEGFESVILTINSGTIHIVSSDDGVNGAGGKDSSGTLPGPGIGPGGWGGPGGFIPGNCHLYINGGYIVVNALGDGIDINGAIDMTGGFIIVDGPPSMETAVDHETPFKMTGGFLLGVGSSGAPIAPALGPTDLSTQYSILVNLRNPVQAGNLIHLQTINGTEVFTFKPTKQYQSVVFCSPTLAKGAYDLYYGGSSTGTVNDGLYTGGTYAAGTKYMTVTISNIVTRIN